MTSVSPKIEIDIGIENLCRKLCRKLYDRVDCIDAIDRVDRIDNVLAFLICGTALPSVGTTPRHLS